MAPPKTFTGARAIVQITDPKTQKVVTAGVFDNISYGLDYDLQPVYTLGNLQPVETVYTSQEPIRVNCSGFRVIDEGPFVQGLLPPVNELLTHEYLSLQVIDRLTGQPVALIKNLRPMNFSSGMSARQMTQMSLSYMALSLSDESFASGDNVDTATAGGVAPPNWPA